MREAFGKFSDVLGIHQGYPITPDNLDSAMQNYKEKIRRLATEKSGEPIYNNSPAHAAAIIEGLFCSANDEVCLVTKSLNPSVFSDECVVEAAREFLSDGRHKLRVLIETDPANTLSTGHPFVQEVVQHSTVECRQLPTDLSAKLAYHFSVADDESFRFEPNKEKWEASAAFGDAELAGRLKGIFESLWAESQEATLPVAV